MKLKTPQVKINTPFSQRLKKKEEDTKFQKFLFIFNSISINVWLIEAITEMPRYAKFIKELVIEKQKRT